ncbi:MAG: ComF family protein [Flavobacteriales bacterium]|nr:ComF family protein [Flavobacteriales bacterium]
MNQAKQKYTFGWLNDLAKLLFPNTCVGCSQPLNAGEDSICIDCLIKLPRTNYHRLKKNPVSDKFRGRLRISDASSFLYFARGSSVRSLIHQLKYNGRQDIGLRLGALYARDLISDGYDRPDIIIPLPLHHSKQKLRGYNQCVPIVEGLNKYFQTEMGKATIKRVSNNPTQTRKGRFQRWENVEKIFQIAEPSKIIGKHVLLIDDVITTGSTLEACGRIVLEAGASRLSVLTIATA